MAVLQTPHAHEMQPSPTPTRRSWWRLALLGMLLSLSIAFNIYFLFTAPPIDTPNTPFIILWLLSFLPYIAACILVLVTKPQVGWRRWLELGLILVGALTLRAIVLPVLPDLSHDSWRYLWDARVTLHGYSPYVYGPGSPLYASLRDFVYNNSRFRNVPTIYPPGAQAIYLLSYLIAPSNLIALKGIFVGFDVVTCIVLAILLQRKGLDMSRCIIYAWCPLPIIEFALQGHLDALTVTFIVLAILCASASWRGSRVVTGFLIAMATLTKIYPIILLVVVVRRRDWALLTTCFVTIILAYVPYLIMGHGQILGFFGIYASEQTPNAGLTQFVVVWIENQFRLNKGIGSIVIYALDALVAGSVSLIVLRLRWQERISMEAATFIMIAMIFAISSHIFPWYAAAFLPWIATQVGPLGIQWRSFKKLRINWSSFRHLHIWSGFKNLRHIRWSSFRRIRIHWNGLDTFNTGSLATLAMWYFTCSSVTAYFDNWNIYYQQVYGVTLLILGISTLIGIVQNKYTLGSKRQKQSNEFRVKWIVGGIFRFIPGRRGKENA
jgi:Glycosyltransferase family 87